MQQQVRCWITSIFDQEGPEDGEHSVSPVARYTTLALAGVPYVPAYRNFKSLNQSPELRKFRLFLDEVVRVMDGCGVRPWTSADEKEALSR